MKAIINVYEIVDDPKVFRLNHQSKKIEIYFPELQCIIKDNGEVLKNTNYKIENGKSIDITIDSDMEKKLLKSLELKNRKLKKAITEILLEICIHLIFGLSPK